MSLEEFDSAAHALGLASEFRDMLTGALLEAHELSIRLTDSIRIPSLTDSVYSTSPLAA